MTAPLQFGLDTFGDVTKDAGGASVFGAIEQKVAPVQSHR